MSERQMRIVFSSGIHDLTARNSSFDSGILRVAYTGKNRNNSFISKETFEKCMPSIYNCPIVCRYDREEDEIGSHDIELVSTPGKGMKIVNATHPVGVIPESAKFYWEEIEDDSGLHEYLCIDALIWKRQEAYDKIKDNGVTDESMEISVKDGEMIDGVYVIRDFEFTAFCLLGTAQPCFESASLEVFSYDAFKQELAEMMHEFKESFCLEQPAAAASAAENTHYSEGGENVLEEKNALMAEYGLSADMIDFNIDEFSVDELRDKFETMKAAETEPAKPDTAKSECALEEQFREGIMVALSAEKVSTEWGEMAKYWYVDYDKDAAEVYCYDCEDWNLYGFSYSMNGDNVVVDFETKRRKKFSIVDYDEGEQKSVFAEVYEIMSQKYADNDSQWSEKYQEAENKYSAMQEELTSLRQYKADAENEAKENACKDVLEKFAKLAGVAEFDALCKDHAAYSVEDLEEKCYAILGRNGVNEKFSLEPKNPKLPIDKNAERKMDDEPYGGVFAKYGINN